MALSGHASRTYSVKASANKAGSRRFIRMIHQRPAHQGSCGQTATQKINALLPPPVGDHVTILAVADSAADDREQDFPKWIHDPPRVTSVFDLARMAQSRLQPRSLEGFSEPEFHGCARGK